jgi:predicted RNA methylase
MAVNAQSPVRAQAWSVDERSRDLGAVYTPPLLAEWAAKELLAAMPETGPIWDIACGHGALLKAVRGLRDDLPLVGFDLDAAAVAAARSGLPDVRFGVLDSLAESIDALVRRGRGRPSGIILNPPWGASLTMSRKAFAAAGFRTAAGQFDSYDVFVERALELLRPGGAYGLIIPDSLLAAEHTRLRQILVEETELHLVARLGEGFFSAVYRGVMVVTGRRQPVDGAHAVRCFRLGPDERRAVLNARTTLHEAAHNLAHAVPQSRFAGSEGFRLELDVREEEREHLERFLAVDRFVWRNSLLSARGVELSKHGLVVSCPRCATAVPKPRRPRIIVCGECSTPFDSTRAAADRIIDREGQSRDDNWVPLIAGEDVHRYRATPSRVIRTNVSGITYKDPSIYTGPKLLVRKTGVGISAAVDLTDSLTTQVVFHYKPLRGGATILLHYLAGVLNSRFMLAYYLRTHGEAEWRSHPYLTQQIIETLPVPTPSARNRSTVKELAEAARCRGAAKSTTVDESELRIEGLVAKLFGFDERDWLWALGVVAGAQQLEAIRELRLSRCTKLPKR